MSEPVAPWALPTLHDPAAREEGAPIACVPCPRCSSPTLEDMLRDMSGLPLELRPGGLGAWCDGCVAADDRTGRIRLPELYELLGAPESAIEEVRAYIEARDAWRR